MSAPAVAIEIDDARARRFEPARGILGAILVLEVAVFSAIGTNFLTLPNAFEVLRLSVEISIASRSATRPAGAQSMTSITDSTFSCATVSVGSSANSGSCT